MLLVLFGIHQFEIIEKEIDSFGNFQKFFGGGQACGVEGAVDIGLTTGIEHRGEKFRLRQCFAARESNTAT